MTRRPDGTGCLFHHKNSPYWWMKYYVGKRACFESTKTTKRRLAGKFLAQRLAEVRTGQFFGPEWERALVDELATDLMEDYRLKGRKSLPDLQFRWRKHLLPFFGGMRANEVTTAAIQHYVAKRLVGRASSGTVNRELAILRRMFNLALTHTPPKVNPHRIPHFPTLKESQPRSGFVEDTQYRKLQQFYPELWWRTLLALAYTFGWRKSELLNLRVIQVDLLGKTLRLDPGSTKNNQGRVVKLTKETQQLLRACVKGRQPLDFVLTRGSGERVKDFRERWKIACHKLGLGQYKVVRKNGKRFRNYEGLVFHDLRRSAVRNLIRAGVPEVVAMSITGHKTRSVFDRYNIVSEADLTDAARRLERRSG